MARSPSRKSDPGSFGIWLREQRIAKKWTGERLAEAADTASGVISNLERGLRRPSMDMVRRLARALYERVDEEGGGYALYEAEAIRAAFPADDSVNPLQPAIYDFVRRSETYEKLRESCTPEELDQLIREAGASTAAYLTGYLQGVEKAGRH